MTFSPAAILPSTRTTAESQSVHFGPSTRTAQITAGSASITEDASYACMAMDGSNYAPWRSNIDDLDALKAMLSSVPPEVAARPSRTVIGPMTVYVEA